MSIFGKAPAMKTIVTVALIVVLAAMTGMGTALAATRRADVTDPRYGAKPDDGKDDTAAIQKAIDDLSQYGVLLIPPGTFQVSMAQGLTISKDNITIIVRGKIQATAKGVTATAGKNMIDVTGEGCQFIGQGGMIVGDGSRFSEVMGPRKVYPAFIRWIGTRDCVVSGLRLRDPPGLHMRLRGIADCKITNCTFEGGTRKVTEKGRRPFSHYFGISFLGAKGLLIQGNHFKPYKGRAQYQWIVSSSTSHSHQVSIIGNRFVGAYDHPIYCCGLHNSVVANNTTCDTTGLAIKLIGWDLVIVGNNVYNAPGGGISARNGSRCILANNLVQNFGHVAIAISSYNKNKADYTDNVVQGNILIGHKKKFKTDVYNAIRIWSLGKCSRSKVIQNVITNAGHPKAPVIWVSGGKRSDSVTISGNTLSNCTGIGIQTRNVHSSLITQNIIHCTGHPIDIGKGRNIILRDNITGKKKR